MKRELIIKPLIGVVTYIVSMVEVIYVWLQLFNGSGHYYGLGELILKSMGLSSIDANDLGQSLLLGPLVMSGYLPIFIALLIVITNSLIAIYTYRLSRARDLEMGFTLLLVLTSIVNASLINLMTNPWLPQALSTALAIAMYHHIDRDNRLVSATLSALMAFLSPVTNLLNVLVPITHWFIKREFNESSQYVMTIGLAAFTYYWIAGAYSIIHEITTQVVLNQVIYLLSTTSFIQLATLGTAIPALVATVLGGVGFVAVVPAILIITLVEVLGRLREGKLAVLTFAVAIMMTVLTSPISPMWPPYQGIGQVGINWEPLIKNYVDIYSLTSLTPDGYINNTILPTYSLIAINPGRQAIGYITPVNKVNGIYAICGDYQLVINGYVGPLAINDYEIIPNQLITNAINYTENHYSLTIPSGLNQGIISINTSEIVIPPGTYTITTIINLSQIPQVTATPLTSTVLPISAGSTITFNLRLNFTGSVNKVIIYGVSYTDQPAILLMSILRNGQVITGSTAEAPSITQGMKPYPIAFDLNVNTTPGIYEIDVLTDQPLILYVTRDSGMEIISGNTAFNYPSNVPAYAIMYITNKTASTWLTISMSIANQSVGMNVTSGGTYELRDVITVTHWINSSISLLITTNVPVLPTNITIGPVLIKSLEPTYCPVPIIIKALERPDESLLISLAALPVAAALPLMPGLRIRQRMRRALLILGLVLMLLFYVVWALGFTNMAPQFYGPVILRFFGVLFIIGLIITIISSLT